MKTLKTHIKPISYLLTILILLQGCTIYKSSGVSLEEATQAETKVKGEKINGEKEKQTGEWKIYHQNGQLHKVVNFKNGIQTGESKEFYEGGQLLKQRFLKMAYKQVRLKSFTRVVNYIK